MAQLGPTNILFDIACQTTATRIAARNSASDVTKVTPLANGFLQIPYSQAGFGFNGSLTAAKDNSGNVTITVIAADTDVTATTNEDVVNHAPGDFGTLVLRPGETTGPMHNLDLYTVKVSGNGNVLHVCGCH